jgi:hypothetical protein
MSRVQDAVLILEHSTSAMLAKVRESVRTKLPRCGIMGRETYLARSVYYLGCIFLALVLNGPLESVLDGGIIRFDKVIFDELDRERGFA